MTRILFGTLIGAVVLIAGAPVRAHDPDTGAPNWITQGGYMSSDGVHCCGPRDCERIDASLVQATPQGFVLHAFHDELVPYSEATPSEDGHYWRCHTTIYRGPDGIRLGGQRRCFFAPVGTE